MYFYQQYVGSSYLLSLPLCSCSCWSSILMRVTDGIPEVLQPICQSLQQITRYTRGVRQNNSLYGFLEGNVTPPLSACPSSLTGMQVKALKCGHHLRDLLIVPVQRIPVWLDCVRERGGQQRREADRGEKVINSIHSVMSFCLRRW